MHTSDPLPYLGLGHFLQGHWTRGCAYALTETALMKGEDHFAAEVGPYDGRAHPNRSSESLYYQPRGRGLSPQGYRTVSLRDLTAQSFHYVRLVEIYDAYRRHHASTASTNRVTMNQESIPELLSSPFTWRNVKSPWVSVPVVLVGLTTYAFGGSHRSLSDADEIVILGDRRSPSQALETEAGLASYRYLLVAAGEEMYFRGIMQTELTERTGPRFALVLSAGLFGVWHIPNNGLGSAIPASLFGAYAGYIYQRNSYDIGEAIALHFWVNFVARTIEFIRDPTSGRYVYSVSWSL